MVVKVSKPEINVREKISELDKPSGTAGQAMLAAETPQEQFNLISAGRRNLIINGAMQVAQRGTSDTGLAYGYHTADRMRSSYNGSVATATRDAIVESVLSDQLVDGYYVNALKRQYPVTTDTGYHRLNYRIEANDVAKFAGQTLTLSYYAKADVPVTFNNVWAAFGGTNIYADDHYISTEWQRYTFTFTCPSKGSSTFMDIAIGGLIAGFSNTSLYFTMLQLEVGKGATPFEHLSYGEDLALCQRYYQRFDADGQDYTNIGIACGTNSAWYVPIILPGGRMRADVTLSYSAVSDFRITLQHSNTSACSSIGIGYNNPLHPNLSIQAGSNSAGSIRMFGYGGTPTAWLAFSAEL